MTYSFLIFFELPRRIQFSVEEHEIVLTEQPYVRIAAAAEGPIKDQRLLEIRGYGYSDQASADSAGAAWKDALQAGLARVGFAADVGLRNEPAGIWTNIALQMMEEDGGRPVLNGRLGLQVYAEAERPLFILPPRATGKKGYPSRVIKLLVQAAEQCGDRLDDKRSLAFDLYQSSFDQYDPELRLVTLVTAIETMLRPAPRDQTTQKLVDQLIETVTNSSASENEKKSIIGSLRFLYNQSINQAGRELVAKLGDRRYDDKSPARFFRDCYSYRSDIVHGNARKPSRQELGFCNMWLEMMVGHLLAGEVLDTVTDEMLDSTNLQPDI